MSDNKIFRKTLIISLVLNLCLTVGLGYMVKSAGGISWIKSKFTSNSAISSNEYYYLDRTDLFNSLEYKEKGTLFVGDSITDRCEWDVLFKNDSIYNMGINSDTTENVLKRIDSIIGAKPKKIFLLIGVNDLRYGVDEDELLSNYKKILSIFNEKLPNTQIYVQSILPINSEINSEWNVSNETIKKVNSDIKKVENNDNIEFIDLYTQFISSEGMLDSKYTNDGLHLNGEGYLLWKQVIQDIVNEQ